MLVLVVLGDECKFMMSVSKLYAKRLFLLELRGDDVLSDYRYLGLSLGPHPVALLRGEGLLGKATGQAPNRQRKRFSS